MEGQFQDLYGPMMYQKVKAYIVENELEEHYKKAKTTEQLLNFSYHFGILPIVVFCYCYLKQPVAIHDFVNNYHYQVSKSETEGVAMGTGTSGSSMVFSSSDKWARKDRYVQSICLI